MAVADLTQWIMTLFVTCGLIVTWVRNGRSQKARDSRIAREQAERDQKLTTNQETILRRLDDPQTGLTGMSETIHTFKETCAKVSTSLEQRVQHHEREIVELKQKRK